MTDPTSARAQSEAITPERLKELLAAATPGPWHHCQAFMTVPAERTVHGPVPATRVDYVSTWPHVGTPKGHRVVVAMEGRESNVRSEDMALIALSPALAARVIELEAQNARLRKRERFMRGISPSVAAMLDEYDTSADALLAAALEETPDVY